MESPIGEKKARGKGREGGVGVRVKIDTKRRILTEIAKINRKPHGKRVHPDDLIRRALDLIRPEHIRELEEASLSHKDRFALAFQAYVKANGPIPEDEYFGKVMNGEIRTFQTTETVKGMTIEPT